MSITKSSPEDIFFSSIVKKQPEEKTGEAKKQEEIKVDKTETAEAKQTAKKTQTKKEPASKKKIEKETAEEKPEKIMQMNVHIPASIKYEAEGLINEMKRTGLVDRYFMRDFIIDAMKEKMARERKKLG